MASQFETMDDSGEEDKSTAESTSWRYCLHIAYYGTGFVGWQRQQQETKSSSGHDSVQEVVEAAVTETLGAAQRVNVTGVSRTDAGTHALYQYGFIRLDAELHMTMEELKDRVNAKLGNRVMVLGVTVPTTGPSRIRSRYKKYIYYLQQGHRPDLELGKYSWFLGRKLDIERIRDALKFLEGTHDFRPFSQGLLKQKYEDMKTMRTVISAKVVVRRNVNFSLEPRVCGSGEVIDAADMYREPSNTTASEKHNSDDSKAVATGEQHKKRKVDQAKGGAPVHFVCIELVANGFLRHMVRRIIGTLRPIGEGSQAPSRMQQVLAGEIQPGPSASAKALWLHRTWLTQEEYDADCAAEE